MPLNLRPADFHPFPAIRVQGGRSDLGQGLTSHRSEEPSKSISSTASTTAVDTRYVLKRLASHVRRWFRRQRLILTVGAVAIAFVAYVVLLWRGAGWLYGPEFHLLKPDEQVTAVDDVRARLLQLAAGAIAVVALVYTALNFRLAREGHVTDRFTKAIEQLGSDRSEVRIGGIYALERIMNDSERDQSSIVEVLAAYIRGHAPLASLTTTGDVQSNTRPTIQPDKIRPPTDVAAALSVLGRRPKGRQERGIDLKETDLRGAHMVGADLDLAVLTDADLSAADMRWINLYCASMAGANLSGAHLRNANLSGADLRVNLSGADLRGADLSDAALQGADLHGADLRGASLEATRGLERSQLDGAMTDADTKLPAYLLTDRPGGPPALPNS